MGIAAEFAVLFLGRASGGWMAGDRCSLFTTLLPPLLSQETVPMRCFPCPLPAVALLDIIILSLGDGVRATPCDFLIALARIGRV